MSGHSHERNTSRNIDDPILEPPRWLVRSATPLLFAYMLVGVGGLYLLETPFNEGFDAIFYPALPVWSAIVVLYVRYYWRWLYAEDPSRKSVLFTAFCCVPVFSLFTWPAALLINTLPPARDVLFTGTLIDDSSASDPKWRFIDRASEQEIVVDVPEDALDSAHAGTIVRCNFRRGPLGFHYRWRHAGGPACAAVDQ